MVSSRARLSESMRPPWVETSKRLNDGSSDTPPYVVRRGGVLTPSNHSYSACISWAGWQQYGEDDPRRHTCTRAYESHCWCDRGCVCGHVCMCTCMCPHVHVHEGSWLLTGSHVPSKVPSYVCAYARAGSPLGSCAHVPAPGGHTRVGLALYHSIQHTTHRLETLSNILS